MAMTASAFDTLTTARDLEAAGFERRQAEAVASAIGNAGDRSATKADLGQLATKTDLAGVKAELGTVKTDLAAVKAELGTVKTDLASVKVELGTVKTDLAGVKVELGTVKTDLASVKAEVGTVKADVRDIKADNKAIKAGIADLRTDIAGLRGRIDGAKWGLGLFLGFLAALGIAIAARIFGAF